MDTLSPDNKSAGWVLFVWLDYPENQRLPTLWSDATLEKYLKKYPFDSTNVHVIARSFSKEELEVFRRIHGHVIT